MKKIREETWSYIRAVEAHARAVRAARRAEEKFLKVSAAANDARERIRVAGEELYEAFSGGEAAPPRTELVDAAGRKACKTRERLSKAESALDRACVALGHAESARAAAFAAIAGEAAPRRERAEQAEPEQAAEGLWGAPVQPGQAEPEQAEQAEQAEAAQSGRSVIEQAEQAAAGDCPEFDEPAGFALVVCRNCRKVVSRSFRCSHCGVERRIHPKDERALLAP